MGFAEDWCPQTRWINWRNCRMITRHAVETSDYIAISFGAKRVLDMTVIFPPVNVFDEVLNGSGSTPTYLEFRYNATQSQSGNTATPCAAQ